MVPIPTRPRLVALKAVIALHAALFWLLRGPAVSRDGHEAPAATVQRVSLRLIRAPLAVPAQPAALASPRRPEAARPLRLGQDARQAQASSGAPPAEASISVVPAPTLSRVEPAASAADTSLLDSEATRRAIRASARATSLTAEVARVGGEPARATAQERLGKEVKDAGRGDCAKGEFAGAGMGLLSLPFLVAAAARGECAR